MKFLYQLVGMGLMLLGVYLLGKNIVFTTTTYPYWWRGISADLSVLSLSLGVAGLFILPKTLKVWGWALVVFGIIFIFLSSQAILNPTSLWQFFVSILCMVGGFQVLTNKSLGG